MASRFPSTDKETGKVDDKNKKLDSESGSDNDNDNDNDSSDFDDEISDVGEDDEMFNELDDAQSELEELHLEELSNVKSKLYTMESRMKDINRELTHIKDCMAEKAQDDVPMIGAHGDSMVDDDDEDGDDEDEEEQEEDPITQVSRLTEDMQNFTNQMRADKKDLDLRLDRIEETLNKMVKA